MKTFDSIKGVHSGYAALGIREPGEWMKEPGWHVFVGGCGVGTRDSLAAAKELLLMKALDYCDRQIAIAQVTLTHYSEQRATLLENGLIEREQELLDK